MTLEDIKIYELKRMNLKGAMVIDGFPSVGLVSSIVSNYLINALHLEQIGIMESIYFPTVALVRNSKPMSPVRIYAGEKIGGKEDGDQIVAFISEFQPPPNLVKLIASAMLDWVEDQKCKMLVSPEGLIVDRRMQEKNEKKEVEVYGVGSTPETNKLLDVHNIKKFEEGVVTGVAGVLLIEGTRREFNVISFLAEANPDYPDARAAAKVIEVIDKILLHIQLDPKPLYEEARKIESQLKIIREQTIKAKRSKPATRLSMYG